MESNNVHTSITESICSSEEQEEKLTEKNNESLYLVVIPGERLGSTREFISSYGTYVSKGFIFSALLGFCRKHKSSDTTKQFIDIIRLDQLSEDERLKNTLSNNLSHNPSKLWSIACLPAIGDYVWARVIRVTHRFVDVDILLSEPTTLKKICPSPYRGTIRSQDIQATNTDATNPYNAFQAGDIVRAFVVSTSDTRGGFLLSTAPISCGVVYSTSVHGADLEPISHNLMRCPVSNEFELRKAMKS